MSIIKNVARFLFTTPEGCVILGAAAFGTGYFVGEAIVERQIKREKNRFEQGIKTGMILKEGEVDPEKVEVIIEQEPGVFGKRYLRVVKKNIDFFNKPEEKPVENNDDVDAKTELA